MVCYTVIYNIRYLVLGWEICSNPQGHQRLLRVSDNFQYLMMFYRLHIEPGIANMSLQAFNQVKGTLQSIIAVLVDTLPPIMMGMPMPCLPMLTGR